MTGVLWSLLAGACGALGALGIILALSFGGRPIYVMPLVFGGAPVVNTLLTAFMNRAFNQLKGLFLAGLLLVITGRNPPRPTPRPRPTLRQRSPCSQTPLPTSLLPTSLLPKQPRRRSPPPRPPTPPSRPRPPAAPSKNSATAPSDLSRCCSQWRSRSAAGGPMDRSCIGANSRWAAADCGPCSASGSPTS